MQLALKKCKSPLKKIGIFPFYGENSVGIFNVDCFPRMKMEARNQNPAWYCARTKPKHEHIAATTLRKTLGLETFLPRLWMSRVSARGMIRVVEPLFPCYLFVRCILDERADEIRHTNGISSLVRFGGRISIVEDGIIEELQECFDDELMTVENRLTPGSEVSIVGGAFNGVNAYVLRNLPARQRVQVLLDILGQPTPVEVDRTSVVLKESTLAHLAPMLARNTLRAQ